VVKELLNYCNSKKLFNKGDQLLLAFSGGKDSVCLFHLLLASQTKFAIAHCNFKLRGKESDEDAVFAKQLGKTHKVKVYCKSFKTEAYAKNIKSPYRKQQEICVMHGLKKFVKKISLNL